MRYRGDLEPALSQFSLRVKSGAKVGIVGRTGAGKSSVVQALFRMRELGTGRILLNGKDITHLGLHDLRCQMGYIPQTPFLFQGSVRANLDPLY